MSESAQEKKEQKPEFFYDATVGQRYEYTVEENGSEYETAHVHSSKFNDDELYMDWVKSWNIQTKSNGEADEKYSEATQTFWDNVTEKVENFNMDGDWKSRVGADEKLTSIANLLAVAIATKQNKEIRGGDVLENEIVLTEAYFNGIEPENIVQQQHLITKNKREEYRRKYNNIATKQYKEEKIGGLSKKKPKRIFVPQNEAFAGLYDEMIVDSIGFVDDVIPIRFKTAVVHHIFSKTLGGKK